MEVKFRFKFYCRIKLAFVDELPNAEGYFTVVEKYLLPFLAIYGTCINYWTHLHDGARVYTASENEIICNSRGYAVCIAFFMAYLKIL